MPATTAHPSTWWRNAIGVVTGLFYRDRPATSTAIAIPTGQCSACGEIVPEADLCSWERNGRPVRLCKACCSYCNPRQPGMAGGPSVAVLR